MGKKLATKSRHSNIPLFQYSSISVFHHSSIPVLLSIIPLFQYSNFFALRPLAQPVNLIWFRAQRAREKLFPVFVGAILVESSLRHESPLPIKKLALSFGPTPAKISFFRKLLTL
jgi:hypothetical protein